ncbi:hypothetical protein AMS68_007889 [Peltaster fructicola]|uniref:Nitrate/nitrite transporter n=1 Tax=Peltaster fructicola TaxID=286661 RepID=A0A6H0Y5Q6_9PEZI|nr:hypothetical protein AMS68_007889 [Peltaster fructicola]
MFLSFLWTAPELNPVTLKARSIPILNPVNQHGRVFFFSWLGFLLAFWSWYAFPPLLTKTIKDDLGLYQSEIANSNIIALTAGLIFRFVSGPLCDRFGPRIVFASLLLAGALPTALAGCVTNAAGLIVLRFFVGILGATFVPCQVWTTAFYDKNVVGSANALVGGWGNSGGGITYFVMPAILDSLVGRQHLSPSTGWRVAFIVPFILITATAIGMLTLCPDTPTGKWSERHINTTKDNTTVHVVTQLPEQTYDQHKTATPVAAEKQREKDAESGETTAPHLESGTVTAIDEYQHEVVVKPSAGEIWKVISNPQSLALALTYFNSFGAELAINSILGAYYLGNFPWLGQTGAGQRAAIFGLVNFVFRPAGGFVADLLYKYTDGSLWAKKFWIHFVGIAGGAFCLALGLLDPHNLATMIGLVLGLAFFIAAGNGANFALVPHVHPHANGVLSGFVGSTGNFGGIIFSIIFRYTGNNYHQGIWIIGIFYIAMNLAVCWIRPIPKAQIGGR